MASLQDIRRRIVSVRNTRKITKAMELVAGARLRRAQTRIEEMRPYADRMQELMVGTASAASSFRNLALMQTARRGAAGRDRRRHGRPRPRRAVQRPGAASRVRAGAAGARRGAGGVAGSSSAARAPRRCASAATSSTGSWAGFSDKPTYADAQAIAHRLAELYSEQEVDRVVLVYNRYVSPLVQRVTTSDLLPIPEQVLRGGEKLRGRAGGQARRTPATSSTSRSRRRSCSGCCRSTSRRSSTGRCSSRRRRSSPRR